MTYEFDSVQLEQIAKLPLTIQALKDKYPIQIANVAEYYFEPPLAEGYKPEILEFFYDDGAEPEHIFLNDALYSINPQKPNAMLSLCAIRADGHWIYMEIEGCKILDRRGGVVWPVIRTDKSLPALLQSTVRLYAKISANN